ncbi:NAD(P)H-hydrate dehydratase [Paenibacillus pasadenensis]|uniref:NAD(P)H-hydrate dehydratase n=1 Tax=Paenibacillus pasadenensis TaxID=217090 RepID=UPI0020418916|nr:NAD(P)H-hydrate dehydratase [Paenibacillus pasadenensis]MCM3748333.1 NAD(P)H-hydrate dehydratase [Paenibacillus pasadenensis]
MRLATSSEIRQWEKEAMKDGWMTASILMETAGRALAEAVFRYRQSLPLNGPYAAHLPGSYSAEAEYETGYPRAAETRDEFHNGRLNSSKQVQPRCSELGRAAVGGITQGAFNVPDSNESYAETAKPWAILVGKGNNGGDGLVAARHLHQLGVPVWIVFAESPQKLNSEAERQRQLAARCGLPWTIYSPNKQNWSRCEGIIDALLGTGSSVVAPREPLASLIREVNASALPIVAADLPSGLDPDTGAVADPAIRAAVTVTFGLAKRGLAQYPGAGHAGTVLVAPLGVPLGPDNKNWQGNGAESERDAASSAGAETNRGTRINAASGFKEELTGKPQTDFAEPSSESELQAQASGVFLLTPQLLRERLHVEVRDQREADSHKGTYGHVLVAAGTLSMSGAGLLSATAALRAGAGLVTWAVPQSLAPAAAGLRPELMLAAVEDGGTGAWQQAAPEELAALAKQRDALVIGPGMGKLPGGWLRQLWELLPAKLPLVLDADGLNHAAADSFAAWPRREGGVVLTPHPGEMGRLLGIPTAEVQRDRIGCAMRYALEHEVTVVLKGARTVIAAPDGSAYINPTGNAGMATGGTGDVLAGVIGSLLAQGLPAPAAAALGVWRHGAAGDRAAAALQSPASLIAGDILDWL